MLLLERKWSRIKILTSAVMLTKSSFYGCWMMHGRTTPAATTITRGRKFTKNYRWKLASGGSADFLYETRRASQELSHFSRKKCNLEIKQLAANSHAFSFTKTRHNHKWPPASAIDDRKCIVRAFSLHYCRSKGLLHNFKCLTPLQRWLVNWWWFLHTTTTAAADDWDWLSSF